MQSQVIQPELAQHGTSAMAGNNAQCNRKYNRDSAGQSGEPHPVNQPPVNRQSSETQQPYGARGSMVNPNDQQMSSVAAKSPTDYSSRLIPEKVSGQSHMTTPQTAQQTTSTTVATHRTDGTESGNRRNSGAANISILL